MKPTDDTFASFSKRKTGGHYVRLMGTLHKHVKAEKAGDAALGMLARIWSFCADTGRHVLSERDIAVIMVRDKNGPRKLRALVDARLLDKVEGGYSPHDWFDHNPGIAPDSHHNAIGTRVDGESIVTGNVTKIVTKIVSNDVEQFQRLTRPLSDSGLRTQDIESKNKILRDGEAEIRPELEQNEPEPADWRTAQELVKKRFGKRFNTATGNPPAWSAKNIAHCQVIGEWLNEKDGDHEKLLSKLLDGFFSDVWAIDNGYPLGALAGACAKYFAPRRSVSGFMPPSPAEAFTGPTLSGDDLFGPLVEPQPKPAGGRRG